MKNLIFLLIFLLFGLQNAKGQQNFTAYVLIAEECPICNYLGKTLKKVSSQYKDQVKFVAVFPQRKSNYKTASIFKKKYGLENFQIEIDHTRSITDRFNGSVTPEVIIINDNHEVLYQGRINNSYAAPGRMRHGKTKEDLQIALSKIVLGKSVEKPWPKPIGCYITQL